MYGSLLSRRDDFSPSLQWAIPSVAAGCILRSNPLGVASRRTGVEREADLPAEM